MAVYNESEKFANLYVGWTNKDLKKVKILKPVAMAFQIWTMVVVKDKDESVGTIRRYNQEVSHGVHIPCHSVLELPPMSKCMISRFGKPSRSLFKF